jgi:glutathione S-transferase
LSLRKELPMNIRRRVQLPGVTEPTRNDIIRILTLWAEARARHGSSGPYLFGTFGAADIFYAPVVTRFITYGISVPGFALAYMQAIAEHEWMRQWISAAEEEQWVIEQFERVA